MKPLAWNGLYMRGALLQCFCSGHVQPVEGRRKLLASGLKAQTISHVLAPVLSSMYAPILLIAFVLAFVCVAFACMEF
jgi:hypothetical protein